MSEKSRYVLINVAAVLFIQTSFSLAALLNCSSNSPSESDALLQCCFNMSLLPSASRWSDSHDGVAGRHHVWADWRPRVHRPTHGRHHDQQMGGRCLWKGGDLRGELCVMWPSERFSCVFLNFEVAPRSLCLWLHAVAQTRRQRLWL